VKAPYVENVSFRLNGVGKKKKKMVINIYLPCGYKERKTLLGRVRKYLRC